MTYTFNDDVKVFMIFDILEDTIRIGPILWHINRKRIEDVKDHILDLIIMYRILKRYLPNILDENKIIDYILCHDLPEAITGDITKFEGISEEERSRVTKLAIDYLSKKFSHVIDFKTILNHYEEKVDINAKFVNMIDKVSSALTFIKYQSEKDIDMDKHSILSCLRNHPFVVAKKQEGYDIADIFYQFHMMSVQISQEECEKYGIDIEISQQIVKAIRGFAENLYEQKKQNILLNVADDFPQEATIYKREYPKY